MPLLEEVQNVLLRLKGAEAARSGVEESQALDDLRNTLSEKQDALQRLVQRASMLSRNHVALTVPPGLAPLQARLDTTAAQFRENPAASTLRSGRRMTALTTALNVLIDDVGNAQSADWRGYYSSKLFAGPDPASIRARLALTPKNVEALARYESIFRSFAAFRNRIPESQEEFDQVSSASKALAKIAFEEKVPAEVAAFFAATASNTGASLAILTPQVISWLRDNHLLEKYVVRAHFD